MPRKKSKNPNGDGSIYYSEKLRRYVGQVSIGKDENGKTNRKTVYGRTYAECKTKKEKLENLRDTGTMLSRENITIYSLAKQMADYKLNLNKVKEGSYYRELETLKKLKPIYNMPLRVISRADIENFLLTQINYSQSTINKEYSLLKRVFNEAVKRKIVIDNPFAEVEKPNSKQKTEKVRALTVEEQKRLYNVLIAEDINYSRQMILSMLTGLRMGEINALSVEDINLTFNTIIVNKTISKGKKGEAILSDSAKTEAGERMVRFGDEVKKILTDSINTKESGIIFATESGRLITTSQVNNQYQRVLKKYSIIDEAVKGKVDLHSLRHTYATRCIEAGMPAKVLQKLLGHTDIKITMNTYCDVFNAFESDYISQVSEYLKKGVIENQASAEEEQKTS